MTKMLTALFLATACALAAPAGSAIPEVAGMPSLAPMLNEVTPGVVNIAVRSRAAADTDNPLFNDPFFRRFFNAPLQRERRVQATGSGVIVDAAQGYVLTNNHVVDKAETIEVTT
ncbi:MAG TPA: serine endoprotease DegQ, partial [Stellaceae bacterium]|nr:serine endoprotease DegQ [Stellaceae bacterium]